MIPTNRTPVHPGEMLEEVLAEEHLTQAKVAEKVGVSVQTVNLLINGKRSITADTALGLARVFDTTPQYWMNLQANFDLYEAQRRQARAR